MAMCGRPRTKCHTGHIRHTKALVRAGSPPQLSKVNSTRAREAELEDHLTERAAILEYGAGIPRRVADVIAVRMVQCSTCREWTPDPLGGGGMGLCATGADSESWSAIDRRPLSAWPNAPRHCTTWGKANGR